MWEVRCIKIYSFEHEYCNAIQQLLGAVELIIVSQGQCLISYLCMSSIEPKGAQQKDIWLKSVFLKLVIHAMTKTITT